MNLKAFEGMKVLIVGDVMIDSYFFGRVERISPEAPVPVVSVDSKENRLGGAANVALNIQALSAIPVLCSVIGNDQAGKDFIRLLDKNQISGKGIIQSEKRITTEKTRVIGNRHQMMRIDHETEEALNADDASKLINVISSLIKDAQVLIFEDYDKGTLSSETIEKIIALAEKANIPTVVDPKKKNFMAYRNASFFKPNLKELKEGLKLDHTPKSKEELHSAINELCQKNNFGQVMVTLSENGVCIGSSDQFQQIPAHIRKIADVSGAGDTVVSVAALALAAGFTPYQIASLSNLAGGLVCEELGVVPINKERLQEEVSMLGKSL